MITKENITILVATKNRLALIDKLLSAVHHRPLGIIIEPGDMASVPKDLRGAHLVEVPGKPSIAYHQAVMGCSTSHVLLLDDDIAWERANLQFVECAMQCLNQYVRERHGVVRMNNGDPREYAGGYFLLSKRFYVEHCNWSLYQFQACDWEMTIKAICLQRYAYCPEAVLPHMELSGRRGCDHDYRMMRHRLCEFFKD